MRRCPVCRTEELAPKDYEGFRLMQCGRCGGHLVSVGRLESIKRVAGRTVEELKEEAASQFRSSSTQPLKCPRCHMTMRRQEVELPPLDLHTDACRGCKLVWLDGGELALLQLAHQTTGGFIGAQECRRRMEELEASPERKARFREALAKLPRRKDLLQEAVAEVGEGILDAAIRSILRSM